MMCTYGGNISHKTIRQQYDKYVLDLAFVFRVLQENVWFLRRNPSARATAQTNVLLSDNVCYVAVLQSSPEDQRYGWVRRVWCRPCVFNRRVGVKARDSEHTRVTFTVDRNYTTLVLRTTATPVTGPSVVFCPRRRVIVCKHTPHTHIHTRTHTQYRRCLQ